MGSLVIREDFVLEINNVYYRIREARRYDYKDSADKKNC